MIAVKAMDLKYNFKAICDKVFGGEVMIVSRPKNENIVLVSEKRYEELERAKRNEEYLAKLDRGFAQIKAGKGVEHELIENEIRRSRRIGIAKDMDIYVRDYDIDEANDEIAALFGVG